MFAKGTLETAPTRERKGSISGDLWNWGAGRQPRPSTEEITEEVLAPAADEPGKRELKRRGSSVWDWMPELPLSGPSTPEPKRPGVKRQESIGTSMWDWKLGRDDSAAASPNNSREASVHNGESERAAGKAMPWSIKMQFGSESERPV